MKSSTPAHAMKNTDETDAHGNARRTGLTVLGLSFVTASVGLGLLILQRAGYVHADPFIGAVGMLVLSGVNALAGTSMILVK
jgi:hypothetical protein